MSGITIKLRGDAAADVKELAERKGITPEAVVEWLVRRQAAQERFDLQAERCRGSLEPDADDPAFLPAVTELGRLLKAARAEYLASGGKLFSPAEIESEIDEQRRRFGSIDK